MEEKRPEITEDTIVQNVIMEEKRPEITEDTIVQVYNEFGGQVSYATDKVRRVFQDRAVLGVSFKELTDAIALGGHRGVFDKGYLVIKDNRVREKLGLEPLGEYNLDRDAIIRLLEKGTLDQIETFLQHTSDENLDKALQVAVDISLSDLNRTNLLMAYSGTNVLTLIQEKEEEIAEKTGVRKRVDGKAPENAATPVRGRKIN